MNYKEQEKVAYDVYQRQFAIDGDLTVILVKNNMSFAEIPITDLLKFEKIWFCPFCLTESNKFIQDRQFIKCNNCNNLMTKKTLLFIKNCSNEEFAKWVYNYRQSGFFQGFFQKIKPDFKTWLQKLYELGISYEFWETYKKLKGDNKDNVEI